MKISANFAPNISFGAKRPQKPKQELRVWDNETKKGWILTPQQYQKYIYTRLVAGKRISNSVEKEPVSYGVNVIPRGETYDDERKSLDAHYCFYYDMESELPTDTKQRLTEWGLTPKAQQKFKALKIAQDIRAKAVHGVSKYTDKELYQTLAGIMSELDYTNPDDEQDLIMLGQIDTNLDNDEEDGAIEELSDEAYKRIGQELVDIVYENAHVYKEELIKRGLNPEDNPAVKAMNEAFEKEQEESKNEAPSPPRPTDIFRIQTVVDKSFHEIEERLPALKTKPEKAQELKNTIIQLVREFARDLPLNMTDAKYNVVVTDYMHKIISEILEEHGEDWRYK